MVCSKKPLKMVGSVILMEHLFYRLYISFLVCGVKCLCEDGDIFANLLENTLGMSICDCLVFQVAYVSELPVEYCNHSGFGLIWWCKVANGALFPSPLTFNRFLG